LSSPSRTPWQPTPVREPRLLAFNTPLAVELGLDVPAILPRAARLFSGNELAEDATPVALAYAGHQFGQFVPRLGDGRALLIGERVDRNGRRRDLQLKGAGPTPFSRNGDGRAALGPVLREYLISEAMHALGVPTTRSLAAVRTGEVVLRDAPLPGAVLTRVAASHVRVGTFEYFAARGDEASLRMLLDHVIARHDPQLAAADNPALALLGSVCGRSASLVADWMRVGFIHGVMNTDNTSIAGETLDYGPCAFLDAYDPSKSFSAIDRRGRYAFGQQPAIMQWNMARLAETLLPLIDSDAQRAIERATGVVDGFAAQHRSAHEAMLRRKLGLLQSDPGDRALADELLDAMRESEADYTRVFAALRRDLSPQDGAAAAADHPSNAPGRPRDPLDAARREFAAPERFDAWALRWRTRRASEPASGYERDATMRAANPTIIPRNHRVEAALDAATREDDLTPFEALLAAVVQPYAPAQSRELTDAEEFFAAAPAPAQRVMRTFCGT
jgi:serine/tyrosine/threonine adenylyltransferase